MSNSPRYEPSMESLKLAVELTRINGSTRAAFDIIQDAALFDAYLFGDLIVALGINDGVPNFPNFKSASDFFNRSLKILENKLLRGWGVLPLYARFSKDIEQRQNQVFTRRSHSSSPRSVSKMPPSDSHSEAGNESVAHPAFDLSVDDLLQIIGGYAVDAIKERAIYELKRRCGESVEELS
ncbi:MULTISPECIES: hypothetical protein [unclassified Saccharibacter]|uniref:hypothetical protein n=1 Tax=unclassified Saccharibacter TaxID=2648722 RepID=UPI001326C0A1|nr:MULTISPECIES: hypothetical protein [unclassified Saccharibacter]MXV35791.1 hypothetical protein [Saccharibacter sp. EH611]MXV57912.1 hypothetical protein [Saccharibacter sp. EH70]MXV66307.1 hypothetical protein [Saccharibacter sp. EH60]